LGEPGFAPPTDPVASYRVFRQAESDGDDARIGAASFASRLGRERVISISNTSETGGVAVTVWFWSDRQPRREQPDAPFLERERELIILDPG
jgi:hypothetical protein